jgi:hypothetical protein
MRSVRGEGGRDRPGHRTRSWRMCAQRGRGRASPHKGTRAGSGAGRFDVVAQLARELEARRLAHAGNVVRLEDEREKRGT